MNGSKYVKKPLRSSALVNNKNDDKYCFIWSVLASLHPCENGNPNRVSNYKQCLKELQISGFDFSKGSECSVMHKFEKLNNLSNNIFELNVYQDQNKWKHELITIEISKNESDKIIDFLFSINHYVLIKKLNVILGKQDCRHICKRCLNS